MEEPLVIAYSKKPVKTSQFESADIVLSSGKEQVYYLLKNYPGTIWTPYEMTISADEKWYYGEYKEKNPAFEEQMKAVLSNLERFWIRGEYRSGNDWGGLYEVIVK